VKVVAEFSGYSHRKEDFSKTVYFNIVLEKLYIFLPFDIYKMVVVVAIFFVIGFIAYKSNRVRNFLKYSKSKD